MARPPARLIAGAEGPAARVYLIAHDSRVRVIDRLGLAALRRLWGDAMALQGMTSLLGGPQDHDELVNYISELEFPDADRAREVYYDWMLARQPAIGQE